KGNSRVTRQQPAPGILVDAPFRKYAQKPALFQPPEAGPRGGGIFAVTGDRTGPRRLENERDSRNAKVCLGRKEVERSKVVHADPDQKRVERAGVVGDNDCRRSVEKRALAIGAPMKADAAKERIDDVKQPQAPAGG